MFQPRLRSLGLLSLFAFALAPAACGGSDSGQNADDLTLRRVKSPPEWDRAVTRPANETVARDARSQCKFGKGSMPAETTGAEVAVDRDIPIEHIVVLMQENRSFDSYFGHLNKFAGRTDIESAPADASNPADINDPKSRRIPWQHAKALCFADTNHEWSGAHMAHHDGKNDGFFQVNQGFNEKNKYSADLVFGERALWYYDETDIPFYYKLASTFSIADHYHSSLLGPTWPNRDFLYMATSRGVTTNVHPDLSKADWPANDVLIVDELIKRGKKVKIYMDGGVPGMGTALGFGAFLRWNLAQIFEFKAGMHEFFEDARKGQLPDVAFVDPKLAFENLRINNDEHPPGDIQLGQKFTSDVVHALFKSPQWSKTALFITYDENGGIYDHVPPPAACAPDEFAADLRDDEDKKFPAGFDRLGFRVPFIAVSPYAKKAHVSHVTYDHTSITRFIEAKFKLPALTRRDANADPLTDIFDWKNPAFMTPPNIPEAVVEDARLDECRRLFGLL